jgi:hypothetical protein
VSCRGIDLMAGVPQIADDFAASHQSAALGRVSRVSPVHTAMRNCTRDEGGPFGFGNQVLISSHRELLRPKAVVVLCQEDA